MKKEYRQIKIRGYEEKDAVKIGVFEPITELRYRYNGDMKPENIFCAVDEKENIVATVDLEPGDNWKPIDKEGMPADFKYDLSINMTFHPDYIIPVQLKQELLEVILERGREVQQQYHPKQIRLIQFINEDDGAQIDFLFQNHFYCLRNTFVLQRDLSKEIPDVPMPEGIEIRQWETDDWDEKVRYNEADAKCFNGCNWSMNKYNWMLAGGMGQIGAFDGDKVVGGTQFWDVTEEDAATENVFVSEGYRRRGIARAFLTESLKIQKANGKKIATLCVLGDNKPALALYESLGYRFYFLQLEFCYDL